MMEISFHSVRDPWNAAVYLVIYFPVGRPWTLYRRFKKSNGTVRQIDLATGKPEDVEWDEGRWTMFRAVVTGALVQIEINGRLVAAITEKELPSGELLPTDLGSACYTHNTGKTGTTRVDRDFFRAWQLVKV